MNQRVNAVLDHVGTPGTLIDVGAAGDDLRPDDESWLHRHLAEAAHDAIAVDITSPGSVPDWVDYRQQSAESLDLDETADTIVISEVLEHLSNPGQCLSRLRKHLSADGRLVLTTPNPYALVRLARVLRGRRPCLSDSHVMLWSETELRALVEREGFEVVTQSFVPPEGGVSEVLYRARPDLAGPYHLVVATPAKSTDTD